MLEKQEKNRAKQPSDPHIYNDIHFAFKIYTNSGVACFPWAGKSKREHKNDVNGLTTTIIVEPFENESILCILAVMTCFRHNNTVSKIAFVNIGMEKVAPVHINLLICSTKYILTKAKAFCFCHCYNAERKIEQ